MNLAIALISAYQLYDLKQNKESYGNKVYVFFYIILSIGGFANMFVFLHNFFK
jgi:hypothetical protein